MLNKKDFDRFPEQEENTKLFVIRKIIEEIIEKDLIQSPIYAINKERSQEESIENAIKELQSLIELIEKCEKEWFEWAQKLTQIANII